MAKSDTFRFRKLDTIGAPDAQQDQDFLPACFVDTGLVDVLRDCSDPRRIIVGRTGSGKTALIRRVQDVADNVIVLPPEQLAIGHIANSNILQFVFGLGVKIDIFFRLLWRHVLIVELIRRHSALDSETATKNLFEKLRERFDTKRQANLRRVLDYMREYGDRFWEDTDHRIKEVTQKVEQDIKAALSSGTSFPVSFGIDAAKSFTAEQKSEVVYRAQNVVNQIQMRELAEMIGLLDEILDDPQQQFYVVIDRLDEDWSDDRFRYSLIRALLETVREFHKVRHAKIIVGLRLDLVDRVFMRTRDAGFQEEKYEGDILRLHWSREEIVQVLDRRVDRLVRRAYTGSPVTHLDVMPKRVSGEKVTEFLLDRTLLRPRDIIHFFNTCIQHADGNPQIGERAILQAEGEYSRARIRALADEWHSDYPNLLIAAVAMLSNRPPQFAVGDVSSDEIGEMCLNLIIQRRFAHEDVISMATQQVVEGKMDQVEYWVQAVEVFYRVGLVGLKPNVGQPIMWAYVGGRRTISTAEINPQSRIVIHKCFWRVLGVDGRHQDKHGAPKQE